MEARHLGSLNFIPFSRRYLWHPPSFIIYEQAGWTIKREDVTLQEKIGKGEFGDVRLGQYR